MGSIGFGVIATFITLYYHQQGWTGAAFSLTLFSCAFVGMRLVFGQAINQYGGRRVALWSLAIECLGLLCIWTGHHSSLVALGAFLTGAGFSLVFPALGVEAVKTVAIQNQGTAIGLFTAFLDLALGLTGPIAGMLASLAGLGSIYLAGALAVASAVLMVAKLPSTRQPST